MLCLGIESTAHTFSVAVVSKNKDGWQFLSNIRKPFVTDKGGLVPSKVSDHHVEHCGQVLADALEKANINLSQIDVVAFSQGPGIGGCLRIGAAMARSIASIHDKPLIGVNHCVAHLEIGRILSKFNDPVLLYASGANTQVIAFQEGKYRVFGETLDTGIGNFLDMSGRLLELGFPAGPAIEQLAKKGEYYPLPYVVKGMDVSFAGIYTAIKKDVAQKKKEDICASIQETVFAMLVEVAERALSHSGKNELILGGGVGCNERLQEMCKIMCDERGAKFFAPQKEFLVDNAAMIAATGILMHEAGLSICVENSRLLPLQRTDQVSVSWR